MRSELHTSTRRLGMATAMAKAACRFVADYDKEIIGVSLKHGSMAITYDPKLDKDRKRQLDRIFKNRMNRAMGREEFKELCSKE